ALFATLAQLGLVVRGLYGEGSEARGHIFQISNQVSLGLSEEEFIRHIDTIAQQVAARERQARQQLAQQARQVVADRVGRAWGILTHAEILSSEEALQLLSDVNLGLHAGLMKYAQSFNFSHLVMMTRPGFLQRQAGRKLSAAERDIWRADLLRSQLMELEKKER
ncbi:MAG: ATP--guanido phosphotransferase, partial [Firmicutes bacterium]|nr:ATP--guanido phosphotransferase [Bacillota bacterium]